VPHTIPDSTLLGRRLLLTFSTRPDSLLCPLHQKSFSFCDPHPRMTLSKIFPSLNSLPLGASVFCSRSLSSPLDQPRALKSSPFHFIFFGASPRVCKCLVPQTLFFSLFSCTLLLFPCLNFLKLRGILRRRSPFASAVFPFWGGKSIVFPLSLA